MIKRLILAPLLLGLIPSANAGIYIYPFFEKGIEVRCSDNKPKHLISFKAGRVMKFKDDGEEKKFKALHSLTVALTLLMLILNITWWLF